MIYDLSAAGIRLCLFMLFLLLFGPSGCKQKIVSVSTPSAQKDITEIQEGEIIDVTGNKELYEERKAFWVNKMPNHYRLSFSFICDCNHRTTQHQEVKKDGKVTTERTGNFLTIEVKAGKVIGIRKEDGEQIPVKVFRTKMPPTGIVEYIWKPGKNENEGTRLLSEPIEFLWRRTQEAIESVPQKKLKTLYDKQFGYIKKIDFISSIPDYEFQGEIKHFTPLF